MSDFETLEIVQSFNMATKGRTLEIRNGALAHSALCERQSAMGIDYES